MFFAKSAPDLMQRLPGLPTTPHVEFLTRNTRAEKNRTINIETYKTRAEIKAENPIREGDEDYLRSARVCAILGISTTTLSRWNMESPPRISFIRLSKGNYRWRKSDVEAYMERQQINRREGDRRSASGGVQIDRRAADRRDVDRRNR
jgi:predicted DNA-binding transcriptional regulator AlpA